MITFCELFFTYGSGKGNEFPRTNEDIRHFSPPEKRNHSTRLSLKLRHHRVKKVSKFFVQKVFRSIVQLQTKDCSSTSSRRGNIQVESPAPQPLLIEPAIRIGSALPTRRGCCVPPIKKGGGSARFHHSARCASKWRRPNLREAGRTTGNPMQCYAGERLGVAFCVFEGFG